MLPDVSRRLEARTSLKTFFYGNFVDEKDLTRGWATYPHLPRYGSHYRGMSGRLDILLETYSYISFRDRVFTTVEILKDIFDYTIEHAAEIQSVCVEGEKERELRLRSECACRFLQVCERQMEAGRQGKCGSDYADVEQRSKRRAY